MSSWLANCGDAGRLCSSHAREAMSRIARKSSARRFVSELRKLDFCLLQRYMEHNRHSLDRIQLCFCRSLKRSDPRNRGATSLWSLSPCLLPLRQAHSRCEMSLRTTNSQVFRPPPEMQPRQRLDGLAHGRANSSSLPGGIFGYGPVSPPPPLQPHGNSLTYASSVDGGIFGGSSGQQGRPNCGAPA